MAAGLAFDVDHSRTIAMMVTASGHVGEPVPFEGVSQIIGPNNRVVVAAPASRQPPPQASQSRIYINVPRLTDLVHEVASVPATAEQMEQVIELLKDIRDAGAADRAAPELEKTPYSPLRRLLPENKEQLLMYIEILLFIIGMLHVQILSTHQPPPIDEQRIIREVEEHFDRRMDELEKELQKESDHKLPSQKPRPRKRR
jgi:hypothetical protein